MPLAGRPSCRQSSEDRARHQASASRIVEIEKPAHQFAGRVQAGDGLTVSIDHAADVSIFSPPKVKVMPQVTA